MYIKSGYFYYQYYLFKRYLWLKLLCLCKETRNKNLQFFYIWLKSNQLKLLSPGKVFFNTKTNKLQFGRFKMRPQIRNSRAQTVWPDVQIKSSRISSKSCPKRSQSRFWFKSTHFKIAQTVTKYLGYSRKKIVA